MTPVSGTGAIVCPAAPPGPERGPWGNNHMTRTAPGCGQPRQDALANGGLIRPEGLRGGVRRRVRAGERGCPAGRPGQRS
ncbi:hypothetical protein GCM10009546_23390 [Actinomadura livida]|uniref:Uncharacterized protein n=1 Tax=Actinomadura livida TaxID=79909 RepID=A0ABN1E808_9ACTN|nr:hypothetical protein GCM10010208_07060 [Actinomadura livida]